MSLKFIHFKLVNKTFVFFFVKKCVLFAYVKIYKNNKNLKNIHKKSPYVKFSL